MAYIVSYNDGHKKEHARFETLIDAIKYAQKCAWPDTDIAPNAIAAATVRAENGTADLYCCAASVSEWKIYWMQFDGYDTDWHKVYREWEEETFEYPETNYDEDAPYIDNAEIMGWHIFEDVDHADGTGDTWRLDSDYDDMGDPDWPEYTDPEKIVAYINGKTSQVA